MLALRWSGSSLEEIAEEFELTRERVRQILKTVDEDGDLKQISKQARKRRQRQEAERRAKAELAQAGAALADVASAFHRTLSVRGAAEATNISKETAVWALESVGVDHRRLAIGDSGNSQERYSDEQLLHYLRVAAEYMRDGIVSTAAFDDFAATQQITPERWPTAQLYGLRFGSWREACDAAGVQSGTTHLTYRKTYTRQVCLDYVTEFLMRCERRGEKPTFARYESWARQTPGAPSGATVRNRFERSWKTAVRLGLLAIRKATSQG